MLTKWNKKIKQNTKQIKVIMQFLF